MASLTGSSVASSYTSLLKLDGNTDSTAAGNGSNAIQVKTGDNEATPLYLNTDRLGIGGQPSAIFHSKGTNAGASLTLAMLENDTSDANSEARLFFVSGGNLARGSYITSINTSASGQPADLAFATSSAYATPTEAMRIDSSQHVGIGVIPDGILFRAEKSVNGNWAGLIGNTHATNGSGLKVQAGDNADVDSFRVSDVSNNTLFNINGAGQIGVGTGSASSYDAGADNLVVYDSSIAGITIIGGTTGQSNIHFGDGTGASSYRGVIQYVHGSDDQMRFWTNGGHKLTISSSGDILPAVDDSQDLGSSSKRFDDIHATNGTIQTSDERLKDNIADSSLGLDFVNALRPVKYKWKDYSYDVEKEKAVEAKEAKEAVMGTRQKTVSKEVEKTRTEIVEEDGKYVQKEISYTETVEEPQYEEVNLYDEDGEVIGSHQIPIMEEYEVEPAVEAIEAKDAVMETKEKTFARTHFGLIAQEVEQVLKDSSLTNNDFAGLIYDEDSDRYGMRYNELISPLIKAVQELSKKVTDLENK